MMGIERWTLILATGDDTGLSGDHRRMREDGRPERMASFDGGPTMLERTLDRAALFAQRGRTVVSLTDRRLRSADTDKWQLAPRLALQAENRGTAVSMLHACLQIAAVCPDATVAALPIDHWVSDEVRFMAPIRESAIFVERKPGAVVMIGAQPTHAGTDYGWLLPEEQNGRVVVRPTRARLVEKPGSERASSLHEAGAFWNTSVMVFKVRTMLQVLSLMAPEWTCALSKARTGKDLERAYSHLPSVDLSGEILARTRDQVHVMPALHVRWSDWGDAIRIDPHLAALAAQSSLTRQTESTVTV